MVARLFVCAMFAFSGVNALSATLFTNDFHGIITLDGDISDFFDTNGLPLPGVHVANSSAPNLIQGIARRGTNPPPGVPINSDGLGKSPNNPALCRDGLLHPSGFNPRRMMSAYNPDANGGTIFLGIDLPGGTGSIANPGFRNDSYGGVVARDQVRPFDADGNGEPETLGRRNDPAQPTQTNLFRYSGFVPGRDFSDLVNFDQPAALGFSDFAADGYEFYEVTIAFGTNGLSPTAPRVVVRYIEDAQSFSPIIGQARLEVVPFPVGAPFGAEISTTTRGAIPGFPRGYDVEFAITNVNAAVPDIVDRETQSIVVSMGSNIDASNGENSVLSMLSPPVIIQQPAGAIVTPGDSLTLTASVAGATNQYQWRKNGVNIPGAINSSLTITNVHVTYGGSYTLVAANSVGVVVSDPAVVIVDVPLQPFSDRFADRLVALAAGGFARGLNTLATREAGEPDHAGKPGGKSVWFGWRAPYSGLAIFDTLGSSFDTLLAVYTNSTVSGTNLVASDEDSGGFLTSRVVFNAQAGTEYQIAIDGYFGLTGNIALTWLLLNGLPTPLIPKIGAQPTNQSVYAGSNATISVEAASVSPLTYQWFRNGSAMADATNNTLAITNVGDTDVGLYWVEICSAPPLVGCVESDRVVLEIGPDPGFTSEDKLEDYFIAARASQSSLLTRAGFPFSQTLNNFGATTQPCEPTGGVLGGSSRWMRLKANGTGLMAVDTIGSAIHAALSVYQGTNLCDATTFGYPVPAIDSGGAPGAANSLIRFQAEQDMTYAVKVDGVNGEQGLIKVNWFLCPSSPPGAVTAKFSQAVSLGKEVVLCAAAFGTVTRYQWRLNGSALAGETNATLVLTNFQPANHGTYSVVSSNSFGIETDFIADLLVLQLALLGRPSNGLFQFRLQGDPGQRYVLEYSTDLSSPDWQQLLEATFDMTGVTNVIDNIPPAGQPRHFYRGRLMP